MNKLLMACLAVAILSGCYDKGSGESTVIQTSSNPIYVSGELGTINVLGSTIESHSRFTMNPDEYILGVHISGEYIPFNGNSTIAQAEMSLYDTRGDSSPDNDIVIGQLGASISNRAKFSIDAPGSFTIFVPLGSASNESAGPQIETLGIRLKIISNGWYGTVTGFRYKIIALKHCKTIQADNSFIRDF